MLIKPCECYSQTSQIFSFKRLRQIQNECRGDNRIIDVLGSAGGA